MPRVGNLILADRPDLIGKQRNNRNGFASQGHKFYRATFTTFMDQHNSADVPRAQAVFRQVGGQYYAVQFFNHVIHPMDTLLLI